jgi:hypothetical protein
VIGAERFGDFVFFSEPFAEIHELATLGTERSVVLLEPRAFVFASRASNDNIGIHPFRNGDGFIYCVSRKNPEDLNDAGYESAFK